MTKASAITIDEAFSKVTFLPNRTPQTTDEQTQGAFAQLAEYRDGGVFIAHYAGNSEWERHANGDEFIQLLEGQTTLFLLENGNERGCELHAGQILVVPQNVWHRFETPDGAKIMTITPQPTEHRVERP